MLDQNQELEITSQLQKGDSRNFDILYNAYFDKVYRFVFFKTMHKETAEDLTSKTFLKVFTKIESFKATKANFSTWIFSIAKNSVIDHYRSQRTNYDITDCWDLSTEENIFENVANKQQLEKIKTHLAQLKPVQRDLVIMRVWQGLSYKEISQLTGRSAGSLKMNFSRTIKTLRLDILFSLLLLEQLIQPKL